MHGNGSRTVTTITRTTSGKRLYMPSSLPPTPNTASSNTEAILFIMSNIDAIAKFWWKLEERTVVLFLSRHSERQFFTVSAIMFEVEWLSLGCERPECNGLLGGKVGVCVGLPC